MADLELTSKTGKRFLKVWSVFLTFKIYSLRLIVEHFVGKKDVFAALPTGKGRNLTFQILPSVFKVLLDQGLNMPAFPVVIVVLPLSSIVKDQVGYLRNLGSEVTYIEESENTINISSREISQLSFYMEVQSH